jgi:hypothetical protein
MGGPQISKHRDIVSMMLRPSEVITYSVLDVSISFAISICSWQLVRTVMRNG